MGQTILQPDANEDFYVLWSSVVDAPVAFGSREEISEILIADAVLKATEETQARFERTAAHGTSSMFAPSDTMIYQQQGTLKRADLKELCTRLAENEDADVTDLLTSFDDEDE